MSQWVESYCKHHEPGCFGLLSLRDVNILARDVYDRISML